MGSSAKTCPQFFKVFLPEYCSETMRIPDAFIKQIRRKIPNRVIVRNKSGRLWAVNVVEINNGLYFQGEWHGFILENSLQIGEFMVFQYNGKNVFDVMILGTNGCERKPIEEKEEVVVEDEDDSEEDDEEKENPFFKAQMSRARHGGMYIPKEVIDKYDPDFTRSIVLEDPTGRQWTGKISQWEKGQVWVTEGWKNLCEANQVTETDMVVCELVLGARRVCKTIKVHINRRQQP